MLLSRERTTVAIRPVINSPARMTVTLLEEFSEVRIGHVGPLLISVWFSQASLRGLEALSKHQLALVGRYGKITNLSVAVKIPKAPGPEAQEWLKRNDKNLRGTSLGTVIVVLERGLGAILARSFIAAASLISANSMHVVKTLEEATAKTKSLPGQARDIVEDASLTATLEVFVAAPPSNT